MVYIVIQNFLCIEIYKLLKLFKRMRLFALNAERNICLDWNVKLLTPQWTVSQILITNNCSNILQNCCHRLGIFAS